MLADIVIYKSGLHGLREMSSLGCADVLYEMQIRLALTSTARTDIG